MVRHSEIGHIYLVKHLKQKNIRFGGNSKLKIYGSLRCTSGKRMKTENRVFFKNEHQALAEGYRPCGNCVREAYQKWKNETELKVIVEEKTNVKKSNFTQNKSYP